MLQYLINYTRARYNRCKFCSFIVRLYPARTILVRNYRLATSTKASDFGMIIKLYFPMGDVEYLKCQERRLTFYPLRFVKWHLPGIESIVALRSHSIRDAIQSNDSQIIIRSGSRLTHVHHLRRMPVDKDAGVICQSTLCSIDPTITPMIKHYDAA